MPYHYVIYEDEECDTHVRRFDNANLAARFIEEELENESGCELGDFEVIKGSPLSIQIEKRITICLGE
jgi:hypothetical protein